MAKRFLDVINLDHRDNTKEFRKQVEEQLWTIHYWKVGQRLLDAITEKATGRIWDTKLLVRYFKDCSDYRDDEVFFYDPRYYFQRPYRIDPTQERVVSHRKTYVYLFHELVHFYHDLLGKFTATLDEEYRTVGLYEYSREAFSENALRKELLLPRRPCYCWQLRPDNMVRYQAEKAKRQRMGLPDQSQLTVFSKECTWT